MTASTLQLTRQAGGLGAEVHGVDLTQPLDERTIAAIRAAWLEHQVLIFRNQALTPEQHLAFAHCFGDSFEHLEFINTLDDYDEIQVTETKPDWPPRLFVDWHCDVTWQEIPTRGAVLHCIDTPVGLGDTVWVNMYAAFDALSPPLRALLRELTAVHDPLKPQRGETGAKAARAFATARERLPTVEHPVVVEHPETGRPVLYVNALFTSHIPALESDESEALLKFLYRHCEKPEFHCRLRWQKHTVVAWDNRCTLHKVINDYWPAHRRMHRIGIEDDTQPKPAGPA